MSHGLLLVFEGIDGTGKSTQCRMLAELLSQKGIANIALAEPTRGEWGMKIRRILNEGRQGISPEEELSWFIKDRQDDIKQNISPALQDNKVVIMDRYYYSTAAYQGALGLDPEKIRLENETFAPIPDLVLIFLTSPETCLERIEASRDQKSAFEKLDYLNHVQDIFKSFTGPNIRFMESVGSVSEVHEKVLSQVNDILNLELT